MDVIQVYTRTTNVIFLFGLKIYHMVKLFCAIVTICAKKKFIKAVLCTHVVTTNPDLVVKNSIYPKKSKKLNISKENDI